LAPTITHRQKLEYEKLCRTFLWGGRKAQIAFEKLYLNVFDGGLGLCNLQWKQKSRLTNWVALTGKYPVLHYHAERQLGTTLGGAVWSINLQEWQVKNVFKKPSFWRDVLQSWPTLYYVESLCKEELCMTSSWYNSDVLCNDQRFVCNDMVSRGIILVQEICGILDFYDYDELVRRYGWCSARSYGKVCTAVKMSPCWNKSQVVRPLFASTLFRLTPGKTSATLYKQ
jgi:hypothetical protein